MDTRHHVVIIGSGFGGLFAAKALRRDVGIDEMYTQVIREIPVQANVWHHVDIALTRHDGDAWVDYFLDFEPVAHVANIGIPLDRQGVPFNGIYPSMGPGERLATRIDSLQFGHGLFSLLDRFPFQVPSAPEASVSIPVGDGSTRDAGRARLFGQGARGAFRRFSTLTLSNQEGPVPPSELAEVLIAAHRSTPKT
jgi:hypothetical protein